MTPQIRTTTLWTLLAGSSLLGTSMLHGARAAAQEAPPQTLPLCGRLRTALIEDFESGSSNWFMFNDGTGVQTPADALGLVVAGGPGKSHYSIHTAGADFIEWGAGLGTAFSCGYDVRGYDGLRFAAKAGATGTFNVQLATLPTTAVEFGGECTEGCNDHYSYPISLPDDRWYDCSVRFDDLAQRGFGTPVPLDLTSASGLQYVFELDDVPFDLSLDNVTFEKRIKRSSCVPLEPERKSCDTPHGRGH